MRNFNEYVRHIEIDRVLFYFVLHLNVYVTLLPGPLFLTLKLLLLFFQSYQLATKWQVASDDFHSRKTHAHTRCGEARHTHTAHTQPQFQMTASLFVVSASFSFYLIVFFLLVCHDFVVV